MRIAIIGTGNVGTALATGLADKGHAVTLGTRAPDGPDARTTAARTGASLATPAQAAAGADIVILALPWSAVTAALTDLGPLAGQTVIDCTNPLGMVDGRLALLLGHSTSGGEVVQAALPQAHVVKTLNQVGAEIMVDTARLPHPPAMFMAGNDATAKDRTARLLADLGFDPLDAGDITAARLLEPYGMVWINQALRRGKGRDWALAAISPRKDTP